IGEHTFETLWRHGLPVVQSTHDPIEGWQRLQHWFEPMRTDDGDQAALIVNPSCLTVLRTIPQLLQDEHDTEDIDERGATEAAKALRYLAMSRPEPPTVEPPRKGRDLSKLDPKTRAEIEYLARCDAEEQGDVASASYSVGEFWGSEPDERR